MSEEDPAVAEASTASPEDAEPADVASPEPSQARGSVRLYLVAFSLVLASFAAMALGGLSLLGRGINVSPTGLFWASMGLSVLALVAGVAALFVRRAR